MPTLSATDCYCGTALQYQGLNMDTLFCPHCDRPCLILRDTKQDCPECNKATQHWKEQYNNG